MSLSKPLSEKPSPSVKFHLVENEIKGFNGEADLMRLITSQAHAGFLSKPIKEGIGALQDLMLLQLSLHNKEQDGSLTWETVELYLDKVSELTTCIRKCIVQSIVQGHTSFKMTGGTTPSNGSEAPKQGTTGAGKKSRPKLRRSERLRLLANRKKPT